MAQAGISTVGVELWYAVGDTSSGTTTYPLNNTAKDWKQLERVNNISGVEMSVDNIDASALEDYVTRYIKGRQDLNGGDWAITFNITTEVRKQLQALVDTANGLASNECIVFQIYIPGLATAVDGTAFYAVVEVPNYLPLGEQGQNQLDTVDVTFTLNEYIGYKDVTCK